jgi:Sec7-like guanine-nucleotide exchange factor
MSKNQVSLEELKAFVQKTKHQMINDNDGNSSPKDFANKYLNKILDKLSEYRY